MISRKYLFATAIIIIILYMFKPQRKETYLAYQERRIIGRSDDYYKYRLPKREVDVEHRYILNIRKNEAEKDNYLKYQTVDTSFIIPPNRFDLYY